MIILSKIVAAAVIAKIDCRVFYHIKSLEDKLSNTQMKKGGETTASVVIRLVHLLVSVILTGIDRVVAVL